MSSNFINDSNLFLEPKVSQYGSNMVMTNVFPNSKIKYLNIDTRFRDNVVIPNTTVNYNITIPEKVNNVKKARVCSVELPMSMYNVSENLGNTTFSVLKSGVTNTFGIANGNYTSTTINTAINTALTGASLSTLVLALSGANTTITNGTGSAVTVYFNTDASNNICDKIKAKSNLGWLLGFRLPSYTIANGASITSEAFSDLTGSRYIYLVLDEFSKGNQNSFIAPIGQSMINKNIIARIAVNPSLNPFGTVLVSNLFTGNLLTDCRSYTGKIDLQKLNVKLINETGYLMNLNGLDFSFCMEIECE
jgi:hypothetical protein